MAENTGEKDKNVPEPEVKKKPGFQKGHKGGPGRPRRHGPPEAGPVWDPEGGIPETLWSLRKVLECKPSQDAGPMQKVYRSMLDKSPKEYMVMLTRAEAEFAAASGKVVEGVALEDMGADRAVEMVGRLLSEFEEEERKVK